MSKVQILFLLPILLVCSVGSIEQLELKQVLVLGRHNIRTPLNSKMESFTPKIWPKWNDEVGHLTTKGALIEEWLGEQLGNWMRIRDLLPYDCPNNQSVYAYANAVERTRKSAEHFIKSAFKTCNITVNYMKGVEFDPVFHPVILNTTDNFKTTATRDMQTKIESLNLTEAFTRLNQILDFTNSKICKENKICDLNRMGTRPVLRANEEPAVLGALKIGNAVADAFLMAYYDGVDVKDIAWGQIKHDDWLKLAELTKAHQDIRFNSTIIAKDVAKPLFDVIKDELLHDKHKFTLLVGHDSNINSFLRVIGIEEYDLDGQNEKTPVGGKIVFEKWYDDAQDRNFVRIRYVYLSADQLREGARISKDNPPLSVVLGLKNYNSTKGFYPWEDFVELLENLY